MVPDTHPPRSCGPMCDEKWSQHISKCRHLSTDLSTRSIGHGRYRRSMPIHLRRITVDLRSSIKNRDNIVVDFIDDTRRKLIERNPPPRGVFHFLCSLIKNPGGRGPSSKHLVQILRGGSSSFGFLIREHSK